MRAAVVTAALTALLALIIPAPVRAADYGDYGDFGLVAALDSSGEVLGVEAAVVAVYNSESGDSLTLAETGLDIVNGDAAEYRLTFEGQELEAALRLTNDELGLATFSVENPGNLLNADGAYYPAAGEVELHYLRVTEDGITNGSREARLIGASQMGDSLFIYELDPEPELTEDMVTPMAVLNSEHVVVGIVTPNLQVVSRIFDEETFGAPLSGDEDEPGVDPPEGDIGPDTPPEEEPPRDSGPVTAGDGGASPWIYVAIVVLALIIAAGVLVTDRRRAAERTQATAEEPKSPERRTERQKPAKSGPDEPRPSEESPNESPNESSNESPNADSIESARPIIVGVGGVMDGNSIELTERGLRIGRDEECAVRYGPEAAGIGRRHGVLLLRDGAVALVDEGSSYGTFIQGSGRVEAKTPVPLHDGDIFYLGDSKNAFRLTFR